jgi:hypothetical protein
LGTACGKYHRCSTLAIIDAGDSDILAQWGPMIHLFKLILRLFLFMPKTNKIGMLEKGQKSLSRFVEFERIHITNQVICLLIKSWMVDRKYKWRNSINFIESVIKSEIQIK